MASNDVLLIVIQIDNFLYYEAEYKPKGEAYWVDLIGDNRTTHDMLSNAHRRAAVSFKFDMRWRSLKIYSSCILMVITILVQTLKPMFEFPFYGYNIKNLTIATGKNQTTT